MRILITSSIFPPEIGGPATYVHEFSRRATGLGHDVKIVTLTDTETNELEDVWVKGVKRSRNTLVRQSSLLLNILKAAKGCDVIYAQNPTAIGLPSVLAGGILRKPVVVKYVGDTAWEKGFREGRTKKFLEDFLEGPDANSKILRIERFVFKRADRIITPSNFLARILTKYHKVPKEKISIISNAADFDEFEGINPPKKNAIITVARLVPWKGVQDIIRLMPEIRGKTGAELWVVGDGPYRPELEALAKELAPDSVKFFGILPHKIAMERIASAKVFVLNSLYEGMPHVLLEAMALGTVIVATDICGNPELIRDGENGILVRPLDLGQLGKAIMRALGGDSDALVSEASKGVRKYSWDSLVSKTLAALAL